MRISELRLRRLAGNGSPAARRRMTWSSFEATVASSRPLRGGQVVRIEMELAATLLGRQVDLGYACFEFSDYEVVADDPARYPVGHRVVRLEPRGRQPAQLFEHLVKEKTKATRRPPPSPRRKGNRGGRGKKRGR